MYLYDTMSLLLLFFSQHWLLIEKEMVTNIYKWNIYNRKTNYKQQPLRGEEKR